MKEKGFDPETNDLILNIGINATINDLPLVSASIDASDRLIKAYEIFAKHPKYPGLLVLNEGSLFRMISKANFFEVMSQQYMFDFYSRRSAYSFFEDQEHTESLILDANTSVLNASTLALKRSVLNRFDPIIVQFSDNSFKMLDYFVLLSAENQVHIQTSRLLRVANEFKKEVLGVVTHDLRNPIGVVLGFANILMEPETSKEEIQEFSKIIHDVAEQMNNMVNDLLVSAMNDAIDFTIKPVTFDLISLMNQIIANFKESLAAKNQEIQFIHSTDSLDIFADTQKVKEILENLISNAIKYSEFDKQIKINIEKLDEKILIKVIDKGPGLTDNDLIKIFGKFERLSAKPTAGESSTGLGLFIVKKLVELHLGKIWVESKIKEGTTFIVELPVNLIQPED